MTTLTCSVPGGIMILGAGDPGGPVIISGCLQPTQGILGAPFNNNGAPQQTVVPQATWLAWKNSHTDSPLLSLITVVSP